MPVRRPVIAASIGTLLTAGTLIALTVLAGSATLISRSRGGFVLAS